MEEAYAGAMSFGSSGRSTHSLDAIGMEWVTSFLSGEYRTQTFGWIADSIESFLQTRGVPESVAGGDA